MAVISNKWIQKDKPKAKEKKKAEPIKCDNALNLTRSNMTKTLRGVRK
jgi:hypothetical protein